MMDGIGTGEKRIPFDRRKGPTPLISNFTLQGGKRRIIRRASDRKTYSVVDVYSPRLFILIICLLLLTLLDSYFTLSLIEKQSATEANPIMAFYLGLGDIPFILVKFFITAAGIVILCLCQRFFVRKIILAVPTIIYAAVIAYELFLLFRIVPKFN